MSNPTPPHKERSQPSPTYAALSETTTTAGAREFRATQQANLSQLLSHYALAPFLSEEARRLQVLKDQMWAAFQSDPTSAPALQIFEATRTYTVALNSQMQIIGQRRPKQKHAAGTERDPHPKSG